MYCHSVHDISSENWVLVIIRPCWDETSSSYYWTKSSYQTKNSEEKRHLSRPDPLPSRRSYKATKPGFGFWRRMIYTETYRLYWFCVWRLLTWSVKEIDEIWQINRGGLAVYHGQHWWNLAQGVPWDTKILKGTLYSYIVWSSAMKFGIARGLANRHSYFPNLVNFGPRDPQYNAATCISPSLMHLFMVALCNRETIYIFMLWFVMAALWNREASIFLPCDFYLFFSSPNLSGRELDVYHTCTHGVALVRI